MRVLVTDRTSYKVTAREVTDEGYLRAPARVARVGIQKYLASELGLTDRNPHDVINVFRPPDEVFNDESLASYQWKEITNDHPPRMVDAESYREYSRGQVCDKGTKDQDFVKTTLLIKDSDAIKAVHSGKVECSAGYYADYIEEKGSHDGEDYEYTQRNIVINHVALVDKARAGQGAKIFDKKGAIPMKVIVLDNGRKVEVEDNVAALIEDSVERMTKAVADANAKVESKDAELQKVKASNDDLTEKLEKEKAKTSDKSIQDKVDERLKVHDAARLLVKDFDCKDKSVDDIKRGVVAALHPNLDIKDKDMTYINARFDMDMEEKEEEDEDEEKEKEEATDSQRRFASDMKGGNQKTVTNARELVNRRTSDAWKQ